MTWEKKRVLITVKAAPEHSRKMNEGVVCSAGITDEGEFIRLYPVPFSIWYKGEGFKKYDWIEVECRKNPEKLMRKESYKLRPDAPIKVIDDSLSYKRGRRVDWASRSRTVLPLKATSLEDLWSKFDEDRTSLGLIKVAELIDLIKEEEADEDIMDTNTAVQMSFSATGDLLPAVPKVEKVPHLYKYKFRCEGDSCNIHKTVILDWELSESIRSWRDRYLAEELPLKIRQKYFDEFKKTDLHLFVGTTSQQPSWVVIGTYRPPI